jgi:predicted transcriptional regulator of viral defense system
MKKTIGRALTELMAAEQRRVISDWRALLLLRRATRRLPAEERRWSTEPTSLEDIHAILARLTSLGEFRRVEDVPYVFEVQAPYARSGQVEEEEVLMEVHPLAALGYATALVFHGLTDEFPQQTHAILPSAEDSSLLPPGTETSDWEGLSHAVGRTPATVMGRPVRWHRLSVAPSEIGVAEYWPRGYPVRVTTPERTLLDGLHHPEWCGGIDKVLRAWLQARDTLDIEALVTLVDTYDVAVLRQRAGFVMEKLELPHPRLAEWTGLARRGGSSKLVASEPFASSYDERWKLSINAPVDVLHEAAF